MRAEKIETRRRVKALKEEAGGLAKRGRNRRLQEVLNDTNFFLSEHSLAEYTSLLKKMCAEDRVVVKKLYSTFTSERLQIFH